MSLFQLEMNSFDESTCEISIETLMVYQGSTLKFQKQLYKALLQPDASNK